MAARPHDRVQHLVSAGGVVYRMQDDQMYVVLCGRRSPKFWGLPKGTPDQGETLEQTALREVREETGFDVELQAPLGTISYWFMYRGVRCSKTVHHNLMVPVGGSADRHDPEFDVVQWFAVEDAYQTLSFENEVDVVRRAKAYVMDHGA